MFKLPCQRVLIENDEYKLIETNYQSIRDNLETIAFEWSNYIGLRNFLKLENSKNIHWFCLFDKKTNDVVACQGTFENIDLIDHNVIIDAEGSFLFSVGGNNYGLKLLKLVVQYYQDCNVRKFSFIVDPTAKISLFVHYYKNLNNDGWTFNIEENEFWKTIRFTKQF